MSIYRFSAQSMPYIPALVFGGTGFIVAYLFLARFSPERKTDWHSLAISSGAAAFGMSFLFWRLFCPSDQPISARRGALVGILTGMLAHPVAWYLVMVWFYTSGARSSLGDKTVNPLEGL